MRWICSFLIGKKEYFVAPFPLNMSTDPWDALPFKRKVDAKLYMEKNFPTAKNVLIEKVFMARA